MGEVDDLIKRYKEIRQRLRYPPNAVPDDGINLKRKPQPPTLLSTQSLSKTDNQEIPLPPPRQIRFEPANVNICLTFSSTLEITAREFGLEPEQIRDRSRKQNICFPRQVAFYVANTKLGKSKNWISKYMGVDHTTVLNATRKVDRLIETDPELRDRISIIEAKINDRVSSSVSAEHKSHLAGRKGGLGIEPEDVSLSGVSGLDQGGGSTLCDQQEGSDPNVGGGVRCDLGTPHDGQTPET